MTHLVFLLSSDVYQMKKAFGFAASTASRRHHPYGFLQKPKHQTFMLFFEYRHKKINLRHNSKVGSLAVESASRSARSNFLYISMVSRFVKSCPDCGGFVAVGFAHDETTFPGIKKALAVGARTPCRMDSPTSRKRQLPKIKKHSLNGSPHPADLSD